MHESSFVWVSTAFMDRSVPNLQRQMASLRALKSIKVQFRQSLVTDAKPYLTYTFTDVYISKIDLSVNPGDDRPEVQVTFYYGGVTQEYAYVNIYGGAPLIYLFGYNVAQRTLSA